MFTVTKAVCQLIKKELEAVRASEKFTIRIISGWGGWDIELDTERPGDVTFEHEGRTVLVVDQQMYQKLASRTLDVEEKDTEQSLAMS